MTTSGTTVFNLDIPEMVEESFQRAGLGEVRSGYDMRTARRSLNLLMIEWANKGINLWTVVERSLPLLKGVGTYTLDPEIVDLIEHMVRLPTSGTTQTDYQVDRISVSTYATRSNKIIQSRPTEIYVDRQRDAPEITLWPIPNNDTYTLIYWYLRRMEDVGSYTNTMDVPFRFLEPLVCGLAYSLARKKPNIVGLDQRQMLKTDYDDAFALAATEDRSKASSKFIPRRDVY